MQRLLIASLILFGWSACTEQKPVGLDLGTNIEARDSTWMASPETPQPKVVLVEESTGNGCSNCPAGKTQLELLAETNPGRIQIMALHFAGLEKHEPANGYFSLENQDTRDLISYLSGDVGQPCAAFNRVAVSGKIFLLRGSGGNWSSSINAELAKTTPVNVEISSAFNESENKAIITTKVAFTDPVPGKLYLSLFVMEDGLIGKQDSSADFVVIKIPDYRFDHVMRDAITPVIGTPLLDSLATKEKGRVFEKRIIFQPDQAWISDKCSILAVVHRSEPNDKSVLQVAKVKLK